MTYKSNTNIEYFINLGKKPFAIGHQFANFANVFAKWCIYMYLTTFVTIHTYIASTCYIAIRIGI